jgi:perosamine synthetase
VIVPECTWTATAAPITYIGATPVFADIDPENWCLSPESVESKITEKTKAIIPVDLYGNMPDTSALEDLSELYEIPIIEDAAEALGTLYRVGDRGGNFKKAGSFGTASVFSFHRTKTITTGEGGMLLMDDSNMYERASFFRDHGRHPTIPYFTVAATPKYMPSNLAASVGYAQFQRLPELIDRKREIFLAYKERLSDVPDLQFNQDDERVYNGVWATSVVFGKSLGLRKPRILESLKEMGLPSRPFFYPLSVLNAYNYYGTGSMEENPNAYDISDRGITLPGSYSLTNGEIDRITDGIRKIVRK